MVDVPSYGSYSWDLHRPVETDVKPQHIFLVSSQKLARLCFTGRRKLLAFAVVHLILLFMMAIVIPPFQGLDEGSHYLRAAQIASGRVIPVVGRDGPQHMAAGGMVDSDMIAMRRYFESPRFADHPKFDSGQVSGMLSTRLSGDGQFAGFSNTAIYPPIIYAVPAAAMAAGQAANNGALGQLYLARLALCVASMLIVLLGLAMEERTQPMLLTAAAFPLMLFQMSTISADAILLACCFPFCALLARLVAGGTLRPAEFVVLAVVMLCLCAGKIAYLPLSILPPLTCWFVRREWSRQLIALLACTALTVGLWAIWAFIIHDKLFPIRPETTISIPGQIAWILDHPVRFAQVIWQAMAGHAFTLLLRMIGVLSYAHVLMPTALIVACLALFLASAFWKSAWRDAQWDVGLATLLVCIVCVAVIYALLYIQNTPVGFPDIWGVQGRYFLPLWMTMAAVLPRHAMARHQQTRLLVLGTVWCAAMGAATLFKVAQTYWF